MTERNWFGVIASILLLAFSFFLLYCLGYWFLFGNINSLEEWIDFFVWLALPIGIIVLLFFGGYKNIAFKGVKKIEWL